MPKTAYNTSVKSAIVVDIESIRQISHFIAEYFARKVEVEVSFSDDTRSTFDDVEKTFQIDNVEGRRILAIEIAAEWDHALNGEIKFSSSHNNISISVAGEEEQVLKIKRFFDEKVGYLTQWYTFFVAMPPKFEGLFSGIKFAVFLGSFFVQELPPFKGLEGNLGQIVELLPIILFAGNWIVGKLIKMSFPLTVFAIGKHYENYLLKRKFILGLLSMIFAFGSGGYGILCNKCLATEPNGHPQTKGRAWPTQPSPCPARLRHRNQYPNSTCTGLSSGLSARKSSMFRKNSPSVMGT